MPAELAVATAMRAQRPCHGAHSELHEADGGSAPSERNLEARRIMLALEQSGFCYITVTQIGSCNVARALQAAKR